MRTYEPHNIGLLADDLEATLDGIAEGYGRGNVDHLARELARLVEINPQGACSAIRGGSARLRNLDRYAARYGVDLPVKREAWATVIRSA